jgi:hypothetical protein
MAKNSLVSRKKNKVVRFPRQRSYVKYLSNRDISYLARKYGYKKDSFYKDSIGRLMNFRARQLHVKRYAQNNAKRIARLSGQSEKQIRRGRLTERSQIIAETYVIDPSYYIDMNTVILENPDIENFRRWLSEQYALLRKRIYRKNIIWGVPVTVEDSKGNSTSYVHFTNAIFVSNKRTFITESLLELMNIQVIVKQNYDESIREVIGTDLPDVDYLAMYIKTPKKIWKEPDIEKLGPTTITKKRPYKSPGLKKVKRRYTKPEIK